jgi:hypothetical protein
MKVYEQNRARAVFDSVFGALVWAVIAFCHGYAYPDRTLSVAHLAYRSAANGILFGLMLYFLVGPVVVRARARRRIGWLEILVTAGCCAVLFVSLWFSMG